ncbi:aldolase [Thalassospira profundimaris]|uniref:Aldolase n=1 Tax=Thalassospira profundimaris TaxID=502049 RepID=A0A367WKK7_9PROT|nr:CoA ester lyase [Thalassospira profundimaris]RCK41002.1 aldolase [Thalassospira profundimaris]
MNKSAIRYDFPLFVPADKPERVMKAIAAAHDAVIIDLEDAVAPENKPLARDELANIATDLAGEGIAIFVRVNAATTSAYADDMALCARLPVCGIVLPKSEYGDQLDQARAALPANRHVIALVETARGIANLRQIAPKSDRLAFGSIDYCADLGCAHDHLALLGARQSIVLESRLADLPPPLDGVTTAIRDAALIRNDAIHAALLGFGGKLLIHPSQITPSREGFSPSSDDLAWARAIVAAGKEGASAFNGEMIDAPVLTRAHAILRRAM